MTIFFKAASLFLTTGEAACSDLSLSFSWRKQKSTDHEPKVMWPKGRGRLVSFSTDNKCPVALQQKSTHSHGVHVGKKVLVALTHTAQDRVFLWKEKILHGADLRKLIAKNPARLSVLIFNSASIINELSLLFFFLFLQTWNKRSQMWNNYFQRKEENLIYHSLAIWISISVISALFPFTHTRVHTLSHTHVLSRFSL